MRGFHLLLLFAILLSLTPLTSALEIKLGKQEYLAGETFLAEINADFTEQLAVKNIFFYKDSKEIEPAFYMLQASKQKYFVWVNLLEKGNYSFAIKNILYKENEILKGDARTVNFEVKPSINSFYQDLQQEIKSRGWQSLSVEENAFALLALAYDDLLTPQGKTALQEKSKDLECWPETSCNIKETALAILALSTLNVETKNEWLIDSQNNLDIGLWDLQINSIQQECKLLINTATQTLNFSEGLNTITLDLKNKPETVNVKLNCSLTVAKIIHTYLGRITEFPLQIQSNSASITLNNKKCFGNGYRNECNTESTAYAVLALNSIKAENDKAIDWLKKNAQTTKEKSIALYLSSSSETEDWLINNQHNAGYWSSKALLESPEADFEATVFATMALKKEKQTAATTKAETWLKKNFVNANLKDKTTALAFIFPASKVEPIITINPAALKTKTNATISIDIFNKAVLPINITAEFLPFKTKQTLSLKQGASEKLILTVPTRIGKQEIVNDTIGSINLEYKTSLLTEGSYSIPVIILAVEKEVEEAIEILPSHFRFSVSNINATILAGEEMLIPIELKDFSHYVIKNISITYSRDLKDIINISPTNIQFINPGEYAAINLTFESSKLKNISGFIEAKASYPVEISTRLPVEISFTKNASVVSIYLNKTYETEKIKTCKEMNGTICKSNLICTKSTKARDTERCCIGICKSKINMTRIVGILLIAIAVIILVIFLIIGLKKPKKQGKDIYEAIEKKYSKFSK